MRDHQGVATPPLSELVSAPIRNQWLREGDRYRFKLERRTRRRKWRAFDSERRILTDPNAVPIFVRQSRNRRASARLATARAGRERELRDIAVGLRECTHSYRRLSANTAGETETTSDGAGLWAQRRGLHGDAHLASLFWRHGAHPVHQP